MAELISTRCGQGKLIITDTHILIERIGNSQSMLRSAYTGLDMKIGPFFGSYTLIFHGSGAERLKASLVKTKDAKAIKALLTGQ